MALGFLAGANGRWIAECALSRWHSPAISELVPEKRAST